MKRNFFIILLILFSIQFYGQDSFYSQISNQYYVYNPALSGFAGNNQLSLSNRTQWRNESSLMTTSAIGYNKHLPWIIKQKSPLVLNVIFLKDNFSNKYIVKNNLLFNVTSTIQLNKNINMGVSLYNGFAQNVINYNSYKWGSQYNGFKYDPGLNSLENYSKESFFNYDNGFSIVFNYNGGYLDMAPKGFRATMGFSLFHANTPRNAINIDYPELNNRKSYFIYAGGSYLRKFRWNYSLLINKQGKYLHVMTGGGSSYNFENSDLPIKSVTFELLTCHNKSYLSRFIMTSSLVYNFYFNFSNISVGLTYESEYNLLFNNKAFCYKAVECSVKYNINKTRID